MTRQNKINSFIIGLLVLFVTFQFYKSSNNLSFSSILTGGLFYWLIFSTLAVLIFVGMKKSGNKTAFGITSLVVLVIYLPVLLFLAILSNDPHQYRFKNYDGIILSTKLYSSDGQLITTGQSYLGGFLYHDDGGGEDVASGFYDAWQYKNSLEEEYNAEAYNPNFSPPFPPAVRSGEMVIPGNHSVILLEEMGMLLDMTNDMIYSLE